MSWMTFAKCLERIMPRQPSWTEYETALLIDAYQRIKSEPKSKNEIIDELSETLRAAATFEIDDIYRNRNGIKLRLAEIDYFFSNGQRGLQGSSAIFRKMVTLYNNNPKGFEFILEEAKASVLNVVNGMRDEDNSYCNELTAVETVQTQKTEGEDSSTGETNKRLFLKWIGERPELNLESFLAEQVIDEVSVFAIEYKVSKKSIWEMNSRREVASFCAKMHVVFSVYHVCQ